MQILQLNQLRSRRFCVVKCYKLHALRVKLMNYPQINNITLQAICILKTRYALLIMFAFTIAERARGH